jgi:ribose transport system permease protein
VAFRSGPPAVLRRYGTLVGFAAIIVFFWVNLPTTFLTSQNLLNITQQVSMLAVVSFTMTIVMAMGDFDLSVGSMASLSGIVAAKVFIAGGGPLLAVPTALLVGIAGGLINGFLVAYVGILPFIATLGALTVFSGFAFWLSDGKTIFGSAIPQAFGDFARNGVELGPAGITIPNLTLVAILVLVVTWVFLEQTVYGRRLYAIGGNAEAARLAGVRIKPSRLAAFGLSGLGAAAAGQMLASRVASANPTQGSGLMLDAIAAVFLGMTMSDEGQPRVLFTLMGVLMLGVLGNGLTQMSVDSYVRQMITGSIIIVAVAVGALGRRRET